MIDPNSLDPSKRKSFFDEGHADEQEDKAPYPKKNLYTTSRERMASQYYEEEGYPEDDYYRRQSSVSGFVQNLMRGGFSTSRLIYAAVGIGGVLVVFIGGWMVFHSVNEGIPIFDQPTEFAKQKPSNTGATETIGLRGATSPDGTVGGAALAPPPEQANLAGLAQQYTPPVAASPATSTAAGNNALTGTPPAATEGISTPPPRVSPLPNAVATDTNGATVLDRNSSAQEEGQSDEQSATPSKKVAKPTPKKKAIVPTAPVTISGGHYTVQLAALGSSAAAEKEWQSLRRKAPDLLGARSPTVQHAEIKGTSVYRLRVKGFASKDQANSFCKRLKAKNVSCTFANF